MYVIIYNKLFNYLFGHVESCTLTPGPSTQNKGFRFVYQDLLEFEKLLVTLGLELTAPIVILLQ